MECPSPTTLPCGSDGLSDLLLPHHTTVSSWSYSTEPPAPAMERAAFAAVATTFLMSRRVPVKISNNSCLELTKWSIMSTRVGPTNSAAIQRRCFRKPKAANAAPVSSRLPPDAPDEEDVQEVRRLLASSPSNSVQTRDLPSFTPVLVYKRRFLLIRLSAIFRLVTPLPAGAESPLPGRTIANGGCFRPESLPCFAHGPRRICPLAPRPPEFLCGGGWPLIKVPDSGL